MNNRVGAAFENVVDSTFRRLGKVPFFRSRSLCAGGFDLVTLEEGSVVINEVVATDDVVVINEAKFQNRLQYADFTPITVNLRRNIQEVLDNLSGTDLSAADKALVRTTLEGYLRDGTGTRLRLRVVTGKATIGPRIQAGLRDVNPGIPLEVVDIRNYYPVRPAPDQLGGAG